MEKIVRVLKGGKIVIHNTDTCLGMAVDVMNEEAVQLLYKVKQMEASKPVSVLCSDLGMAMEYGVFSPRAIELVEKYLPGALTLIVPRTEKLPHWINPGMDSIGVRIPDDTFSLEMVKGLGNSVTTTSCNISGEKVCLSEVQVREVFAEYIDTGEVSVAFEGETHSKVSTIIRVDREGFEIIRQGGVDLT